VGQLIRAKPEAAEQLSGLLEPQRTTAASVDALAHLALRDPAERQAYLELRSVPDRVDRVLAAIGGLLCNGDVPQA
jgi:Lon protease-like protein